jgi:hypothetical protein
MRYSVAGSAGSLLVSRPRRRRRLQVFPTTMGQEDMYESSMRSIVDQVSRGLACCVFAYGQVGLGGLRRALYVQAD